jgi:hypothetical protein
MLVLLKFWPSLAALTSSSFLGLSTLGWTYTAGPAISIKRLMAFMPCQNTIACSSHMVAKHSQPSAG